MISFRLFCFLMGYLYPPQNNGKAVEFSPVFIGIVLLLLGMNLLAMWTYLLRRCFQKIKESSTDFGRHQQEFELV